MSALHIWRIFCLILLHSLYVALTDMRNVIYKRQCEYTVNGGVLQSSPSSLACAEACSALKPCQCHGCIYNRQQHSCRLLAWANVTAVSANDTSICIMVSVDIKIFCEISCICRECAISKYF